MDDTRQQLINLGWRQGLILDPSSIDSAADGSVGHLVLTQTCDCINPSFEKEPHLELLPLYPVSGKEGRNTINGRNPRQIQFKVLDDGAELWVEAKLREIFTVDRNLYTTYRFSANLSVGVSLHSILVWRAARYLRTAFPDSFVNAFRGVSSKFGKILKASSKDQLIDSLLISLVPFGELEKGDRYELQVLLMIAPQVMGNSESVETLKALVADLTKLLEKVESFDSPKCQLLPLKEMSLYDSKDYEDFTEYDYLSFGE